MIDLEAYLATSGRRKLIPLDSLNMLSLIDSN